jgi:hypothetical protein
MQIASSKVEVLNMNPRGLLPRGIGAKYLFEVGGKLLKGAFDASKTALSQSRFKAETEKLLAIFSNVCQEEIEAIEFLYFAEQLMSVADLILETKLSMPGGNPPIYAGIANVPLSNIVYESSDERQEVNKMRRIAEGRKRLG